MKLQNVPLAQITENPWRDEDLHPIDAEQIEALVGSIHDHDFFSTLKGRRRKDGMVEIACGHARVKAACKAKLETVPVFVADMDDDEMLRVMTDENATQSGGNPGAVMNEVAAVTRRLIGGLFKYRTTGEISPVVKEAFPDKNSIGTALGRLLKRLDNLDAADNVHLALGYKVLARYLGHGDPAKSNRSETQLREAMGALRQSGRYDQIVEEAMRAHAPAVVGAVPGNKQNVAKPKTATKRSERILDERTAHLFPNEHQFKAFRETVTTQAARKVIPVDKQYKLAKEIMDPAGRKDFSKKQVAAPYIKVMVQAAVQDGMKQQRQIDKEERDRYFAEQLDAQIADIVKTTTTSLRSSSRGIDSLILLIRRHPGLEAHPRLGGFSVQLDRLVKSITDLSKALK